MMKHIWGRCCRWNVGEVCVSVVGGLFSVPSRNILIGSLCSQLEELITDFCGHLILTTVVSMTTAGAVTESQQHWWSCTAWAEPPSFIFPSHKLSGPSKLELLERTRLACFWAFHGAVPRIFLSTLLVHRWPLEVLPLHTLCRTCSVLPSPSSLAQSLHGKLILTFCALGEP